MMPDDARHAMFLKIKEAYDDFYRSLLRSGKLPMRETPAGFWGIAAADDIFSLFQKISLHTANRCIDLGSGDGKVALIASLFFKNVCGYELDIDLYQISQRFAQQLSLQNAQFYNADYHTINFSSADIVFIHPDKPFTGSFERKISTQCTGTFIVYGDHFLPKTLRKIHEFEINLTKITAYRP